MNHKAVYQLLNGPIDDADGFNDGTCNYYLLVRLRNGAYALLYLDEQRYFSQRWRFADPYDCKGVLGMSLAYDVCANPDSYGVSREKKGKPKTDNSPDKEYIINFPEYWDPFLDTGLIGDGSRLAVSAQVVLVTGDLAPKSKLPADSKTPRVPLIYSTNFSWGTRDRTWRWRRLPPNAECWSDDAGGI